MNIENIYFIFDISIRGKQNVFSNSFLSIVSFSLSHLLHINDYCKLNMNTKNWIFFLKNLMGMSTDALRRGKKGKCPKRQIFGGFEKL